MSAGFLGNIGPFAELDVVKPEDGGKEARSETVTGDDSQLEEQDSIPEINVKARLVNFTIEPDNSPIHQETLAHGTPFQICIPYRGVEVALKIGDGRLEIIKLLQEEVMSRIRAAVSLCSK